MSIHSWAAVILTGLTVGCAPAQIVGTPLVSNAKVVGCYRVAAFDRGTTSLPPPPPIIELSEADFVSSIPEPWRGIASELLDHPVNLVKPPFRHYARDVSAYWEITRDGDLYITTATTPTNLHFRLRAIDGGLIGTGDWPTDIPSCTPSLFNRPAQIRLEPVACPAIN